MFLYLVTLLCLHVMQISSLDCYQCSNLQHQADCHTLVVCPVDAICAIESTDVGGNVLYNMSCKHAQDCPNMPTTQSPPAIIGRRATQLAPCSECCSRDACNKALCSGTTPPVTAQCADDPSYDCAHFGTLFDICSDIHHAKTACRRYCGLCSLVDGFWSSWSAWSDCGVTCDNGTISRTRTCSNPAPANGGLNCTGENRQEGVCHLSPCPVHGGWSAWAGWSACSVSCDVGLEKRRRNCSNPYPARNGHNCPGDPMDVKICSLPDCSVVMFKARNVNDTSPASGSLIRYTINVVNIGGGYNTSTGYFTAPYNGLYTFNVQICTWVQKRLYVEIMAAGNIIGTATQIDKDYTENCSSGDGVAELKAGDKVWIKCYTATSGTVIYQNSYMWNSFSGSLLHRTI